jgi:hypothetical protein
MKYSIAPQLGDVPHLPFWQTWRAIQKDFVPSTCLVCSADIFCITDAEYVVCPRCKSISSLEPSYPEQTIGEVYGVGLGFTFENLVAWQARTLLNETGVEFNSLLLVDRH